MTTSIVLIFIIIIIVVVIIPFCLYKMGTGIMVGVAGVVSDHQLDDGVRLTLIN